MRPDAETVGREAQQHLRKAPPHGGERLHRLDRIGERIARPGDADDREVGHASHRRVEIGGGLRRREHGARDARAALIHAVELPVAEIALEIAARRDRQVDAAVRPVRLPAEARMLGPFLISDCQFPIDGRLQHRARGIDWRNGVHGRASVGESKIANQKSKMVTGSCSRPRSCPVWLRAGR
jgi:hypothetical protein